MRLINIILLISLIVPPLHIAYIIYHISYICKEQFSSTIILKILGIHGWMVQSIMVLTTGRHGTPSVGPENNINRQVEQINSSVKFQSVMSIIFKNIDVPMELEYFALLLLLLLLPASFLLLSC